MIETDIYRLRFSGAELDAQVALWRPICRYLQRYVPEDGAALDLGAGFCHFINNITAKRKIAVDVNGEALRRHADPGVECLETHGAELAAVEDSSIDAFFASNVYEHFDSRENVARSLAEAFRMLRPGGRAIILQPNFAYCAQAYYDFFDHRLAFTHRGMAEGLTMNGFELERSVARFLPYTTKSRLPKAPWLVSAYLAFPPAWLILGQQMLLVGRKPA